MGMKVLTIAAAMFALCTAITACGKHDLESVGQLQVATKPPDASAKPVGDIAWFEGDVDAAFERANAEGKPVFLYWSAEWCPPCHELKATLFTRPEFQAKLKLFVPVYLDGDAEGAQGWGEKFRVVGYPTIVILKGDRTELTRVTGGMDLARYNDVLDLVLGDVRPARDVLASLDRHDEPLSPDDCRRLAYNAWIADDALLEAPANVASALQRAVERCPAGADIERARLTVAAAFASSTADAQALQEGKPPSAATAALVKAVYDLLGDRRLALGAGDMFVWLGGEFFAAVKASTTNTRDFLARWNTLMNAVVEDPQRSDADRIIALAIELRAVMAMSADGKVPDDLAAAARQRVNTTLSKDHSEQARPMVVNNSMLVLSMIGDTERLFAILDHEVRTAKQAYYYMSSLAEVEEERGNKDKAVAWLERAYRESRGAATRFEWGTKYVLGLVRMRADDAIRIRSAALTVLGELDGPDRIYMRTAMRLKRLDSTLREWNKDGAHATDIAALRKHMDGICGKIPQADAAREKCDAFLAET